MIEFTDLKPLIARCCQTPQTTDVTERFGFSVDIAKMEQEIAVLNKNCNTSFHVLAFQTNVPSRYPTINDIQMLTEYFHEKKEFDLLFNGETQIASLMLYSTKGLADSNKNKPAAEQTEISFDFKDPKDQTTTLTSESMYKICNECGVLDEASGDYNIDANDFEVIKDILGKVPLYMIIIYKVFNTRKDKFEYVINIRSGYRMVGYHKFSEATSPKAAQPHQKQKYQKQPQHQQHASVAVTTSVGEKIKEAMSAETATNASTATVETKA